MRCWVTFILGLMWHEWLWRLAGKEELEFTPHELVRRRILFGFTRTRLYQAADIQSPHFALRTYRRGVRTSICFTYRGKEIHLCDGITQPEAKEIVTTLLTQHPELSSSWRNYGEGAPVTTSFTVLDLK